MSPHTLAARLAALAVLLAATLGCHAQPVTTPHVDPEAAAPAASGRPGKTPPLETPTPTWPGITLHRNPSEASGSYLDLDAKVVLREGEWIELLACTPGTLEYESILTVAAKPSHIHLALVALGLQPGNVIGYREIESRYELIPPKGPAVAVSILVPDPAGGPPTEVPANTWLRDQATNQPLQGNTWIFTGSQFVEYEGKQVYTADLNGTVLTLVNFGDDLLARQTSLTNQTDNKALNVNTSAVPPLGTPVTLRLRPATPPAPSDPQPAP